MLLQNFVYHIRKNMLAFVLVVIAIVLFLGTASAIFLMVFMYRTKKKKDRDAVRERTCQYILPVTKDSHPNPNVRNPYINSCCMTLLWFPASGESLAPCLA